MGCYSMKLVILSIISSMTIIAMADTTPVSLRDLLQRQKTVVRQAREEGSSEHPTTIIKYIKVPVYTKPPTGSPDFKALEEEPHRYDTPFELPAAALAAKIVDIVPKGKALKCRLLESVDSATPAMITAEVLEDCETIRLKGRKVMGKVARVEGNKLFLAFTDIENGSGTLSLSAQAMNPQGELGLKADTVDRRTEAIFIQEVGTVVYGLGKAAINASTAGLGSGVVDRVSGIDQTLKTADVAPILGLKKDQKFLLRLEEPLKFERDWLL